MAGWAKAPDFADRPQRLAEVRAQTIVDKHGHLETGMTPVACRNCGTEVLVRKSSAHQTSVQWPVHPADHCPVFREQAAGPGRHVSCPHLQRTIDHAAAEGLIPLE